VIVSPAAGTPDASPRTQISVLGVMPDRIRSIQVRGSASGLVVGAVHAYSDRRGASYVLRRSLKGGEGVTVTLRLAGRAPLRWSFTVARLAATPPILDIAKLQPAKLQHFVSEPDLLPPRISVGRGALDGDVFLTPLPSPEIHPESNNALTINPVGPGGPMIVDGRGRLIWFKQLAPPEVATNLRAQRYIGHDVLTWWQGKVTFAAFGLGVGVIADRSYRTLHVVHTGNGYSADLHEFLLTPAGDALFTIYSLVRVHLPGTPPGALSDVLDSIAQQVDVRTGLVVWEWHALGHIPLRDSYATAKTSAYFDAYHFNAIQPLADNRVLVSARDTSAVYEINRTTGRVVWTLGGKASTFHMGPGARFFFQHDARLLPGSRVSLFDDEAGPPIMAPSSRGLILSLNLRHRTATVAHQYKRPGNNTSAESEGSVQMLPGGNVFVGFGSARFFSAFTRSGRLVFDASLPKDDGSYRDFVSPWHGAPRTRPVAVARRGAAGRVSIFVSWNGATDVSRWQVLAHGKAVKTAAHQGFETRIDLASRASTFVVRALSASGRPLRRSPAVRVP
jgi:Arylsulfotransferase (ASST)